MSMLGTEQPKEYTDGRTKQSFKDETDVNKIIARHARMGTLSHLEQWGGQYGDLAGFDFQTAQNQIAKANTMFEQLPAEVRREFHNDPAAFIEYVNDPENKDDLHVKLPALAKPGTQLPNVRPTGKNPPKDPTPPTPPNAGGATDPKEPT